MARIQGVPQDQAGPIVRLVYRFMRRGMKKLTGRQPAHGSGIEPVEIWAHQPKMMSAMGKFQGAVRKGDTVDERLKYLVELKGSQMIGCEWCLDFGSFLAQRAGTPEAKLRELSVWRESGRFDDRERLVLEYAEAMTRTPAEVSDGLFASLRERFDERQMVELTMAIAIENLYSRSNWAFGLEGEGYSEGSYCVRPETDGRAVAA